MNVWRIAARSIARNRRRTLVTTGAMALAGSIMVFYSSLVEGMIETLERNALAFEIGEVQIHAEGYRKDPDIYRSISDAGSVVGAVEAEGLAAVPRVFAFGLAASGGSSAGVQLRGIDIEREAQVTRIHEHLLDGRWLDDGAPKEVVLGRKLARSLRAKVSSEVVVLSQAADGGVANELYRVRGVLSSVGELIDRGGFFMTEGAFRELMVFPSGAHEVAIRRRDSNVTLDEARRIAAAAAPEAEAMTWRQLQPALARMIEGSMASTFFLLLITYAAIAMVVLNAALMSVFERIREFGIMKALGVTPAQVAGVVFVEVVLQALLASAVSLGVGLPVSYYYEAHGLDLSGLVQSTSMVGVAFEPIWYTRVSAGVVAGPIVALLGIVVLAAVYPGIKAAVIRPIQALHHR